MTLSHLFGVVAGSVVSRRPLWLASFAVLLIVLLFANATISFRLDAADFMPTESAATGVAPDDLVAERPPTSHLVVFLETTDTIDPAHVATIFEFLEQRLHEVDNVNRVVAGLTPAETRFLEEFLPENLLLYLPPGAVRVVSQRITRKGIETALLGAHADSIYAGLRARRERDPLGLLQIAAGSLHGWQGASRIHINEGMFALPGERGYVMLLESTAAMEDIGTARNMVQAVDAVLDQARTDTTIRPLLAGTKLHLVGYPVLTEQIYQIMRRDVLWVALAATVVSALLLALFFGRALAPLVLLAPVALGLMATAAGAALLFGAVSLIAWLFIGLMIGLGVDYGIHIAVHYWVHGRVGTDRTAAVASALTRPGGGVVLSGLTSAAAFLAILAIPYPGMRQVSWLTSAGVLAILAASLTLLPLLLSMTTPRTQEESPWFGGGQLFVRIGSTGPLPVLAGWTLFAVAALAVIPSVRVQPDPWKLKVTDVPAMVTLNYLRQLTGSSFASIQLVSRGETLEEALARDREAVGLLQGVALQAGVASIHSLARWLPNPDDQRANLALIDSNPQLFSSDRFRSDFVATLSRMENPGPFLQEEYLPHVVQGLDPPLREINLEDLRDIGLSPIIDRHLIQPGKPVVVSYVFLRQFSWKPGVVSNFLEVSNRAGLLDLPGVSLIGEPLRTEDPTTVGRALLLAVVVATVLVGGILWLRFHSLRLLFLCLTPLACGLSAGALVMWVLDIELNLLIMVIAPSLVGIAVDDGIHMIERLRSGQELGTVLRESGSGMAMTTLTSVGGLACLALATFPGVWEAGLVGAVSLLVSLLASLQLVPVGWRAWG